MMSFRHFFVPIYSEVNRILTLIYTLFFNYTEYLFCCLLRATTHMNWEGLAVGLEYVNAYTCAWWHFRIKDNPLIRSYYLSPFLAFGRENWELLPFKGLLSNKNHLHPQGIVNNSIIEWHRIQIRNKVRFTNV